MTAGYRLVRVLPRSLRFGQRDSAAWCIDELRGVLISRGAEGWRLQATRLQALPDWLSAQMRGRGTVSDWSRGPFATRQDLLEALRVEHERAEQHEADPSVLGEALA